MRFLRRFLTRLRNYSTKRRDDERLREEIEEHIALQTAENVRAGLSSVEARRRAMLKFGAVEAIKEDYRAERRILFIDTFLQDLHYGLRMLRKSPGFTAVAILTLALGIGANTAIFSLINTLFLQPLPLRDSASLVDVYGTVQGRAYRDLSYPDYLYYRDHAQTVADLAAQYPTSPIHLVVSQDAQEINGSVVTWNYFRLLKLTPALGRFFLPEEDEVVGRNAVAVISYGLWQERFACDRHVLGKSIELNGTTFGIVGVAPQNFQGAAPGADATDVWIPSAMFHVGYRYCDAFQRGCRIVTLIGRLKSGQAIREAQAEMTMLARQLETAYSKTNKDWGVMVVPARGTRPDVQSAQSATLLGAMVILVLMIACANLAGLMLARGVARRKEIAVRLSLGANRVRLVQQLLTESLLLSSVGGMLGLPVAFCTQSLLMGFYANSGENGKTFFPLNLNASVLLFALCISLLTGVLFGLIPALEASKPNLVAELKEGGSATGARRSRLRSGLVVVQVSVSLLLLISSGLLARSLQTIYRGAGFDPSHLLWVRLRPSLVGYDRTKAWTYQREVIRRVEAIPGVIAASPEDFSPIRNATDVSLWLPGRPPVRGEFGYPAGANEVGPRYFETFGIPLLQGREFSEQDQKGTPNVAIANETLARHFWPGAGAIGRAIVVDGQTYRIVGVVEDAQYRRVTQQPSPFLYTDYWQQDTTDTWAEDSRTLIRVAGDPRVFLARIRKTISAVDPNVPIFAAHSFREALADEFQPVRMASTFVVCFGALALFLSAMGLHGILAFYVGQRTREIGIRMALGAERSNVAGLVLRQATVLALAGVGGGIVAALVLVRYLASFLYGVKPYNPLVFAGGTAVIVCVALLACYIPARRAMRADPMVALRYE
jgi:predicted permease